MTPGRVSAAWIWERHHDRPDLGQAEGTEMMPIAPKYMLIVLLSGVPVKTDFLYDDLRDCLDSAYFYTLNSNRIYKERTDRGMPAADLRAIQYACIPHEGYKPKH